MSALKTQIKNLKSQPVDYDFLTNFYSVYHSYCTTDNPEELSRLKVLAIPLANSFLSRSNNRFSYDGGEEVFEDLFSYCYSMLITDLQSRRLNFPDVKQLYAYFDKRLVLGVQSFYVSEFCKKTIPLEEVDNRELIQNEFELDTDSHGTLSRYIKIFSSYHDNSEVLFQLASFMVEALLDSSTFKSRAVNKYLLSLKLDPKISSNILLKLKAFSIARCALIFTLEPESDPYKCIYKNGHYMLDSQFLYVMALEDKYPGIMELYHTLGSENMKRVLLLLEGRQIIFPRIKDFNKTQMYIDSFLDLINGNSLEEISQKLSVSPENLRYNLRRKFSSLKNLDYIFEILPDNVKELLNE